MMSRSIWNKKDESSLRNGSSSKTALGTATASPGYEHLSFPRVLITASFFEETSKTSNIVSGVDFRIITPAFRARTCKAMMSVVVKIEQLDHQSYPNSRSYHVSSSVIDLGIKMFWMEVERWNMSTV